ncbi:hypothetical protein VARIO8X_90073 [Burkholderiales bacterium 8X]|nr:hypothetical protein VARIO8X_90073 [Burkholderiales bacterium 8X]
MERRVVGSTDRGTNKSLGQRRGDSTMVSAFQEIQWGNAQCLVPTKLTSKGDTSNPSLTSLSTKTPVNTLASSGVRSTRNRKTTSPAASLSNRRGEDSVQNS